MSDIEGPIPRGTCAAVPTITVPLGTPNVPITHPSIQAWINCVKGDFTDNVDGPIPPAQVVLIGGNAAPAPPAPTVFPAGAAPGITTYLGARATDLSGGIGDSGVNIQVTWP